MAKPVSCFRKGITFKTGKKRFPLGDQGIEIAPPAVQDIGQNDPAA